MRRGSSSLCAEIPSGAASAARNRCAAICPAIHHASPIAIATPAVAVGWARATEPSGSSASAASAAPAGLAAPRISTFQRARGPGGNADSPTSLAVREVANRST